MLYRSERFQKEYRSFIEQISKITNEKVKKDLDDLLNKLVKEVKEIDSHHSMLIASKEISNSINDSRNQIADIRKKITRKLKEWDQIKEVRNS